MPSGFEFQEKFVAQIKSVTPPNISLADELADLLNVSTDSVYRRLRCQSSFSFDEISVISKKFGISLDGLLSSDTIQVTFNFNPLYEDASNFGKYMAWYSQYLNELTHTKGVKVIYAADDVPVFRNFKFPNLTAFKGFYWSKAVLNYEMFNGKKFDPDMVPKEIIEMNKKTYKDYSRLNCVEIWTDETLTSTLKQVQFFWESDLFKSREQAMVVVNEIRQMMDELKSLCENDPGTPSDRQGQFMLYNSEVMIGNNCVLVDHGESKSGDRVFLGHNTFNTISTYNEAFANETRLWMDNLIKKSILLSGSAEKQRARFFRRMEDKITALEKNVMSGEVSF